MRIIPMLAAALMAAGLAAAPARAADIVTHVLFDSYSKSDVNAFAGSPAKVEVYFPPQGDPDAVADALRLPGWYQQRAFVAVDPQPVERGNRRFVLVFGIGSGGGGDAVCGRRFGDAQSGGDGLQAAYCEGDNAVAEAHLASNALGDPQSPAFERSMRGLFRQMLPTRDPDRDPDECFVGFC